MSKAPPLPIDKLYTRCDPQQFRFSDTTELAGGDILLGQQRALDAINFALRVDSEGYNLYAMGIPRGSRVNLVRHLLETHASKGVRPPDWCYIHNFAHPGQPSALSLPAGHGPEFQQDITQLLDDLRSMIPAAFESEEYKNRRQFIEQQIHERQNDVIESLREKAREQGVTLMPTPSGFAFAPIKDDQTITPEIFKSLPDQEKEQIEATIKRLQKELHEALSQFPAWQKEAMGKIRELNNEVALNITTSLVRTLQEKYQVFVEVVEYLENFQRDIAEQGFKALMDSDEAGQPGNDHHLSRYKVNLLVEQVDDVGAPIVYEDNPVLANLVGQIEHQSQMGTLHTDLTLIKPGALHYANGGYLILEIEKLLTRPFAWDALKRTLMAREIRIDPLERAMGWMSTVGLDPAPIPLDVKVILVGDARLYHLLTQFDPEFAVLFKVVADFDDQVERTADNDQTFAQLIASIANAEKLLPCDPGGVARLIEYSSRIAADAERLSTDRDALRDLMVEADFTARGNEQPLITADSVSRAWGARIFRNDRIRERMQEQILRETLLVDTSGEQVGQINGLAVYAVGQFHFGKPSRITARTHVGRNGVVDIERKVELGGPSHSKGVLILSSFLAARYSPHRTLSLSASLVFEQSYGGVDGDSASSTELYALLSALSDIPINQSFAVTGSVNQFGEVQAIGGVNEKIEGFFDICQARGLTGNQGVLIPAANVKHLMLREDVREAAAAGQFSIYPISTIDQGIELLTGVTAGSADEQGEFPADTVNAAVAAKLERYSDLQRAAQDKPDDAESGAEA